MNKKSVVIFFVSVIAAAFLLGTAAPPLADAALCSGNLSGRLIGVLITTVPLGTTGSASRFSAVLKDVPVSGTVEKQYVFEGISGIRYYTARIGEGDNARLVTCSDEAVTGGDTVITITDGRESIALKGSLYCLADASFSVLYYNPVYQTADGSVYAVPAESSAVRDAAGSTAQSESSDNAAGTELFETDSGSGSFSVKISEYTLARPVSTTLIQYDAAGRVLRRDTFAAGTLPAALNPETDTAWIVAESTQEAIGSSPAVTRVLYQPGDPELYAFYSREDDFCVRQTCQLSW